MLFDASKEILGVVDFATSEPLPISIPSGIYLPIGSVQVRQAIGGGIQVTSEALTVFLSMVDEVGNFVGPSFQCSIPAQVATEGHIAYCPISTGVANFTTPGVRWDVEIAGTISIGSINIIIDMTCIQLKVTT